MAKSKKFRESDDEGVGVMARFWLLADTVVVVLFGLVAWLSPVPFWIMVAAYFLVSLPAHIPSSD